MFKAVPSAGDCFQPGRRAGRRAETFTGTDSCFDVSTSGINVSISCIMFQQNQVLFALSSVPCHLKFGKSLVSTKISNLVTAIYKGMMRSAVQKQDKNGKHVVYSATLRSS